MQKVFQLEINLDALASSKIYETFCNLKNKSRKLTTFLEDIYIYSAVFYYFNLTMFATQRDSLNISREK